MKKLLPISLVCLMLFLFNSSVSAKINEIPYYERFTNPSSGWEVKNDKDGSSGYVKNGYELKIYKNGDIRSVIVPVKVPDSFIVEVEMRFTSGGGYYSLLFNLGAATEYLFVVKPQAQEYCVMEYLKGDDLQLIQDNTQSDYINTDDYNILKVGVKKDQAKLYINNHFLQTISIKEPSDQTGLAVLIGGSGKNTIVHLDSFSVTRLQEGADEAVTNPSESGNIKIVDFSTKDQGFPETDYFRIQNGQLNFNYDTNEYFYSDFLSGTYPADITVSIKTKWNGGVEDNGFGLIFHCKDYSNYYVFEISSNGYYALFKLVNNQWRDVVSWQDTELINSGFNSLKVTCQGRQIQCYLNEQCVIDIEEDLPNSDQLMVGVGVNSGVKCSFDDLKILTVSPLNANKTVDFSSKNQGFSETDYYKIKNGILSFNGGKTDKFALICFSEKVSRDFTVSIKAKWDNGAEDYPFGLVFRYVDIDAFYCFEISNNGYYKLEKSVSSGWKDLIKWKKTSLIKSGFNQLKVTCQGQSIKCYLNNQLVIYIEDELPDIDQFMVGVGAQGGVKCSFDDFEVTEALDLDSAKTAGFQKNDFDFLETVLYERQVAYL